MHVECAGSWAPELLNKNLHGNLDAHKWWRTTSPGPVYLSCARAKKSFLGEFIGGSLWAHPWRYRLHLSDVAETGSGGEPLNRD